MFLGLMWGVMGTVALRTSLSAIRTPLFLRALTRSLSLDLPEGLSEHFGGSVARTKPTSRNYVVSRRPLFL